MKQGTLFALTALLGLAACNGNVPQEKASTQEKVVGQAPATKNIVSKHINIPYGFSYLTNLGSVDIIYTQGDYSIEVEGDSTTLNYLNTEFGSNLLTVSVLSDNNQNINKYGNTSHLTMHVSCPELKCVSICGNGNFESRGAWRADDLQMGVMGSGQLKVEQVECTQCNIQSGNVGDITIGQLKADDVTLVSYGSANIDILFDVKELVVLNEGKQRMRLRGQAKEVSIKKPEAPNLINELNGALSK